MIGSTHKLEGFHSEIKSYIGPSKAITAGDQNREFCDWISLSAVGNTSSNGWPASCEGFGSQRGDNICSNLRTVDPEVVSKPCLERFKIQAKLSDHALHHVTLGL
jgi:hypothetical protein